MSSKDWFCQEFDWNAQVAVFSLLGSTGLTRELSVNAFVNFFTNVLLFDLVNGQETYKTTGCPKKVSTSINKRKKSFVEFSKFLLFWIKHTLP